MYAFCFLFIIKDITSVLTKIIKLIFYKQVCNNCLLNVHEKKGMEYKGTLIFYEHIYNNYLPKCS